MENSGILVDTSIIIDFLRKQKKNKSLLWEIKSKYQETLISSITVFELYAGATDSKKRADIKSLLRWFKIVEFTEELGELSGKIYRNLKKSNNIIEIRDLFIGSTAILYGVEIATLNNKHFENIRDIQIYRQ